MKVGEHHKWKDIYLVTSPSLMRHNKPYSKSKGSQMTLKGIIPLKEREIIANVRGTNWELDNVKNIFNFADLHDDVWVGGGAGIEWAAALPVVLATATNTIVYLPRDLHRHSFWFNLTGWVSSSGRRIWISEICAILLGESSVGAATTTNTAVYQIRDRTHNLTVSLIWISQILLFEPS